MGTDRQPLVTTAVAIAAGVFILDVYTPHETAPQYLYVLPVLLTVYSSHERSLWGITALCVGLTALGAYLSPSPFNSSIVIFNRATAMTAILAAALLVRAYRHALGQVRILNRDLEARVEDRTLALSQAFAAREALNRNLHDEILQMLYTIVLQLESSGRTPTYGPIAPDGLRARALQHLALVMQKVRGYISDEPAFQSLFFDEALSALVRDLTTDNGPRFELEIAPDAAGSVPAVQVEPLLLIVREALSNCVRHAHARHATVRVRRHEGVSRIEVTDDGVGFQPAGATSSGRGLGNMAARARRVGATYDIATAPGRGVRIAIELPVQKKEVAV